jgi:hypothetical protein
VKFAIGGLWTDTTTKLTYRFTSTVGAYAPLANQLIVPSAATGAGVTIGADGVIQWTNGTSASPLAVDGWFPTSFRVFRLRITGGTGAPTALAVRLRTLAPADNSSNTYSATELLGRNATASSGGPSTTTSWAFPTINNAYTFEGTIYGANTATATGMLASAGSVELPQASSTANLVTQKFNTHNTATAMGGMTIQPFPTASFTGTLLVTMEGIY